VLASHGEIRLFGPFIIERFSVSEIGFCEGSGEEATLAALTGLPRRLSLKAFADPLAAGVGFKLRADG